MKSLNLMENPVNSGYLLIPRKLLNRVILHHSGIMSEEQAFLSMLLLVSYKNTKIRRGDCLRGESLRRMSEWSELFGWPLWKTPRRIWNRPTLAKKEMGIDNAGEYFMSLRNVNPVRKAVNYLRCKSFQLSIDDPDFRFNTI